jgi:hypothetical protein
MYYPKTISGLIKFFKADVGSAIVNQTVEKWADLKQNTAEQLSQAF